MFYYQHHIGDFIKATSQLTDSQTVGYLRLLWMYYDAEKPLPNDIDVLAMQIGLSTENTHLLLRAFFKFENDAWTHTRCDKEISEYHEHIIKKSNAGKASAERRKNNSSTDVQQVFNGCSTDEQLTVNQEPITNNHKPTNTPKPPKGADGRFDKFWAAYPKKVGKFDAKKSFDKRKPDDQLLEVMLAAIRVQSNSDAWRKDGGQFIPNPSTWLNQGRWEDEGIKLLVTTPPRPDRDPALVKAERDFANAVPPSLEVLARMAELRKGKVV